MLRPRRLQSSDILLEFGLQREYLSAEGKRCCANATTVEQNARHVMAFARWSGTPVLSCVDVRRRQAIGDSVDVVRPVDSVIEEKLSFSLLPDHVIVECDNCLCVALDMLQRTPQAVFRKYDRDPFSNPKLDRLLTEMPARRFVVFGCLLEHTLRLVVLGLLRRGRRVALLDDASGHLDGDEAGMALRQLGVKGCEILGTEDFLNASLAERKLPHRPRRTPSRSVA